MRAAIYNQYLDTLGGGERYTLSFAKILFDSGWKVDVQWDDVSIKNKLETRFGLDLKNINFVKDVKRGDGYDLCFWVSDGSIPTLRSRKNILHFQVPFKNVNGKSLLNKMKLFRIDKVICNSEFTKKVIDQEFGINSLVVYPPCDIIKIKPKRKSDTILYVGRFSKLVQDKGQEILINQFKKFYDRGYRNWKLVLAGGVEIGVDDQINKLKSISRDYPIKILQSPSFSEIRDYYGIAKIFWSAAGYGSDENIDPQKMEHFGITTVEAMAGGCVPIVFNGGGQKEIIIDGENGFVWNKESQLVSQTIKLIESKKMNMISKKAILSSKKYSYEEFKKQIIQLL